MKSKSRFSFSRSRVVAEQLKDWKSPVPPANVPAYRALYTGYITRSRTAKQFASPFSQRNTRRVEEKGAPTTDHNKSDNIDVNEEDENEEEDVHNQNDIDDDGDDDDDGGDEYDEKSEERHSRSETQRVVWSRHEELILENEVPFLFLSKHHHHHHHRCHMIYNRKRTFILIILHHSKTVFFHFFSCVSIRSFLLQKYWNDIRMSFILHEHQRNSKHTIII